MKKLLLSLSMLGVASIGMAQSLHAVEAGDRKDLPTFIKASELPESQKVKLLNGLKFAQQNNKHKTAKTTVSGDRLVNYSTYTYYGSYELSDTSAFTWGGSRLTNQYTNYLYGELPNVDYEKFDDGTGWHNDGGALEKTWKTMHSFDALNNMITEHGQNYDAVTSSWINVFLNTAIYSGTSVSEYTAQEWASWKSAWKNRNKYLYTYTAAGDIASFTVLDWDSTALTWVNNYRYTDTYTGTDIQSRIAQYWNATTAAWDNSVYFKYNYTAGLNAGYVAHSWDAATSTWNKGYRDTNTYSGTDLVETINQNWISTSSSWQSNFRDSFTRSGGKIMVSSRRNWDNVLNTWTIGNKYLYTYAGSNLSGLVAQKWIGGDTYENENKGDYIYTGGNLTEFVRATWNTGTASWDNKSKKEYTFNSNNSLLSSTTFDWMSGAWAPQYSNEAAVHYYYEPFTAIKEQNATVLSANIFPNPATAAKVYVDYFTDQAIATTVVLRNITGQELFTYAEQAGIGDHSVIIPVAQLSHGIYFVNIMSNGSVVKAMKLVK